MMGIVTDLDGIWSTQTLRERLPDLIDSFAPDRIENCAYALGVGSQVVVTGGETTVRQDLAARQCVDVPPGQFAYVLTEESVTIPPDALGLLSMKFGEKIRGLINVSGFHVDPGYRGQLLFAVYNAGPQNIVLAQGDPTFLLWYASLDRPADDLYKVSGPGRTEITADDLMKIQGEVASPQALALRLADLEARFERREEFWSDVWKTVRNTAIGLVIAALLALLGAELVDRAFDDGSPSQDPTTTQP